MKLFIINTVSKLILHIILQILFLFKFFKIKFENDFYAVWPSFLCKNFEHVDWKKKILKECYFKNEL